MTQLLTQYIIQRKFRNMGTFTMHLTCFYVFALPLLEYSFLVQFHDTGNLIDALYSCAIIGASLSEPHTWWCVRVLLFLRACLRAHGRGLAGNESNYTKQGTRWERVSTAGNNLDASTSTHENYFDCMHATCSIARVGSSTPISFHRLLYSRLYSLRRCKLAKRPSLSLYMIRYLFLF